MAHIVPLPDPIRGSLDDQDRMLHIDCDECILQDTEACGDCVISFLCGTDADAPVVVDLAEARAMRLLDEAGLAPPLRHRRSTG